MKAYAWTVPDGNRFRLILDPAPRLQIESEVSDDWDDTTPQKWPVSLFAILADLVGVVQDSADGDNRCDEALEECFEITELAEPAESDDDPDDDLEDTDDDDDQ